MQTIKKRIVFFELLKTRISKLRKTSSLRSGEPSPNPANRVRLTLAGRTAVACFVFCWQLLPVLFGNTETPAAPESFHSLVLLGDPHLPSKKQPPPEEIMQAKSNVIAAINTWSNTEAVVVLGDITALTGTKEEYDFAAKFLQQLRLPMWVINGNHDAVYKPDKKGRRIHGGPDVVKSQNERFAKTFGLQSLYYTKHLGNYFLVFLACDDSTHLAQISTNQLDWLKTELKQNANSPTLIFFHSPLAETLPSTQRPDFIAQPVKTIQSIIQKNPQVFMWISGHTHTTPANPDFASSNNIFKVQVHNIHCPDMDRQNIWTTSLFLHPEKVLVRTFSHSTGEWLPEYDRTIIPPNLQDMQK